MDFLYSVILALATVVSPSGVTLERLADNSAVPPSLPGSRFSFVREPPVPCGDAVLFRAVGDNIRNGLYSASSRGLEVIANEGTPVPGSSKTFQDTRGQACVGDQVVFLGDDDVTPSSSGRSVYTWNQGDINLHLKEGTMIGAEVVQSFNELSANSLGVGIVAALIPPSIAQAVVIQPFGGTPSIVADKATVLPGQTNPVTIFSRPLVAGSDLVFHARTRQSVGIYRWTPGQGFSIIADNENPVPALGGGTFGIFDFITILDYGVVFGAGYSGGFGIFVSSDGEIQPLVLPGHVTEGGLTITSAGLPQGAGSLLTFLARTTDNPLPAVFVSTDGTQVRRILGPGDTIEGITVGRVISGADHATVAVLVESDPVGAPDEVNVIYRASFPGLGAVTEIPIASGAGLAALAFILALAGIWLLRRSHS